MVCSLKIPHVILNSCSALRALGGYFVHHACLLHEHTCSLLDHQLPPRVGSPGNHKSPSSALSSVLHSIPSGRKQKKIPAALKEVSVSIKLDRAEFHKERCHFPLLSGHGF